MTPRDPIAALCDFVLANWGGEIDTLDVRAFRRALAGVPWEILCAAGDRLVREAAAGRRFFPRPTPSDVLGACAHELAARRQAVWAAALARPCPECEGRRWRAMVDAEGVERLRRCACWVAARREAEAVGPPLALPAAEEEQA